MRLFLLVILLSSQVYAKSAEQCMTEAIRITVAQKMKAAIVYNTLGDHSGNTKTWNTVTSDDLCATTDRNQSTAREIEELKATKAKMLKFSLRELKEKGKIDGAQFDSDKDYLKENEICSELEKQFNSDVSLILDDDCPVAGSSVVAKIRSLPFESSSFEKSCANLAPLYLSGRKKCNEESKKSAEVNREPPGEEIAPAEDEPVKVKLKKPVVDSVQPAKVDLDSKPRSGASAQ